MEIPNGISTADLASLLDDAPDENTCNCSDSDRLTQDQIEELACGQLLQSVSVSDDDFTCTHA